MTPLRAILAISLLVALALAGCAAKSPTASTTSGSTAKVTSTGTHATSHTGTGTSAAPHGSNATASTALQALLTADKINGTVPLNVTFTFDVLGKANTTTWRLAFGDGQDTNGTAAQLPSNRMHGYKIGGNFTATFTATSGTQSVNATVKIKVGIPKGANYPKVFTFGSSKAGCAADAYGTVPGVPLNCVNYQGGPTSAQVDGFWQPLDARYIGQSFTSTLTTSSPLPDSDCYFIGPDAKAITGDCSNSSSLAAGKVPLGTAWMFIYPYATPASGLVVTFK